MTKEELVELLRSLGLDPSSLPDGLGTKITERIILKKFNGDGPSDRTDEPVETIIIEDGKILREQ